MSELLTREAPVGYFTSRWGEPEYTDWMDESMSWKQTCYLGDWSFLWGRRYTGPDLEAFFSAYTVNSYATFEPGRAKHVIQTNDDGKVIHEGVLTRLEDDSWALFGRGGFLMDYYLRSSSFDVESEQLDWFFLQVSGPTSMRTMDAASGQDLRDLPFMRSRPVEIAGRTIRALRQGMAGGIGVELQGPIEWKEEIIDAVMKAGREHGIRRLGGRTVFVNHLEACFPTIIVDYLPAMFDDRLGAYRDEFLGSMDSASKTFRIAGSVDAATIEEYYRSPIELGWSKVVNLDHDFPGRDALAREKAQPRRVIRTLEWDERDVADVYASLFTGGEPYQFMDIPRDQRGFAWFDRVLVDGTDVGVASSRGYSYAFRRMLSLAVVDVAHAALGTPVEVVWGAPGSRQKIIRAVVAPAPYLDDSSRRADLTTVA